MNLNFTDAELDRLLEMSMEQSVPGEDTARTVAFTTEADDFAEPAEHEEQLTDFVGDALRAIAEEVFGFVSAHPERVEGWIARIENRADTVERQGRILADSTGDEQIARAAVTAAQVSRLPTLLARGALRELRVSQENEQTEQSPQD